MHEVDEIVRCLGRFEANEVAQLRSLALIHDQTARVYGSWRGALPPAALAPWIGCIDVFGCSETLLHGPAVCDLRGKRAGQHAVRFSHQCSFILGGVRNLARLAPTDPRACSVQIDMVAICPTYRGPASVARLESDSVRELMEVRIVLRVAGRVVAEAERSGGPVEAADLETGLFTYGASVIAEAVAPAKEGNFGGVMTDDSVAAAVCDAALFVARRVVGQHWGVAAGSTLCGLVLGGPGSDESRFSESDSDNSSDFDCCDALWGGARVGGGSGRASPVLERISQIVFEYMAGPDEVWRAMRSHLTRRDVRDLASGLEAHHRAAGFLEALRNGDLTKNVPWAACVRITRVDFDIDHVDSKTGGAGCRYRCEFVVESPAPCSACEECMLTLSGDIHPRDPPCMAIAARCEKPNRFIPGGATEGFAREDSKKRRADHGDMEISLTVGGQAGTAVHTWGRRIGPDHISDLVWANRRLMPTLAHATCAPGKRSAVGESFYHQVAALLWGLLKGTRVQHRRFGLFRQSLLLMRRGGAMGFCG